MNPIASIIQDNSRLVRRISRLLALFMMVFYLSLILFNEDVRTNLTLPFALFSLVVLSVPLAWRFEKKGGLLTRALSIAFGMFILINALVNYQFPLLSALIGVALIAFPLMLVGWLFYTLGQYPERDKTSGSE